MNRTDIEWADYTWNPVVGCSPASEGCDNCYAARIITRFKGTPAFPDGFKVTLHPERLDEPRKLKGKGKRIFVCSMSDIFHPDVPDGFIEQIFNVMRETPQHAFFVLTKRPERMVGKNWAVDFERHTPDRPCVSNWYATNTWVGVSVENQEAADKRVPVLIDLAVAHRFVSVEPMLGSVDLDKWFTCQQTLDSCHARGLYPDYCGKDLYKCPRERAIEWTICGAETGPGARYCQSQWACDLQNDCIEAGVPFFFKKWNDDRDGMYCVKSMVMPTCREWPEGVPNESE